MYTFSVVVLVCSMSVPAPDCSRDNAVDVARGPTSNSPVTCGLHGQAMIAPTSLAPSAGQYVKVVCERHAPSEVAARD